MDKATPAAQPSQAPVVQAGEYPPLPEELFSEFWGCVAVWDLSAEGEEAGAEAIRIENVVKGLMRAYVDADRASSGATTQAVRFMTSDDCQEHIGRTWLTHEEDAAIAAFCAVNAGRTIPADGKIGGV